MKGDVSGVRISPNEITFADTKIHTVYSVDITVKNISSISKSIRYYAPQTKKFRLKVKNTEAPVAPGLEVTAVIEYETNEAVDAKDRVVITVDGDVIEVPLLGEPAKPNFYLQTPADFGNVVLAAKTIDKEITLYNRGAKAGNFKITYNGNEPVTVIPSSGTVPAHSQLTIRVEYVTRIPGIFHEVAQVELQGQPPTELPIKGCVVERTLELLDQEQKKIECLRFGATYYGTDRTEWAYVYNNSPEPVNFVCVLDENAVGQELGVDLTMSTAATLAQKMQPKNPGQLNMMNSLVSVVPNQGVLNPYDRMMVCFRFSPRWTPSKQGFACSVKPPPRQDFAIFMRFLVVGAKEALAEREENRKDSHSNKPLGDVHAEVAIVATALPVLLTVNPIGEFNFGVCPLNERVDTLCTISNNCSILPVNYQFRRIAHFRAQPASGKINPGKSENVIFSFQPNQIGNFKVTQYIDVLGEVADFANPFLAYLDVINSTPVFFVSRCDPESKSAKPRLNLGISPKITNETGLNSELTFKQGLQLNPKGSLAAAQKRKVKRGHRSAPSDHRGSGDGEDSESLIAFPNDRYASIRPTERGKRFRTIFTGCNRHNYTDPDYSYTDEEMAAIDAHKKHYESCINDLREDRREKVRMKEHKQYADDINIGIKVAAGLKPKKLTLTDIKEDPRPPTPPNSNWKLTSSKELEALEKQTLDKPLCDGLKAIPQTDQEKKECSAYLTPSDLHKIVIGPAFINFGDVCMRSMNTNHINIVNNLESHIHVQVSIDCRELRQTSPLSQVIPPMSKATVPVIFESNTKGKFQRSINYSINAFYKNHLTVMANVVPPSLEMNTEVLEVGPTMGLPAEAGMRNIISLTNPLNYSADFTWYPVVGERGTAFSIRPASGTVDAHQKLDCEVVFHPSYLAPEDGKFSLKIHGGVSQTLECVAKFGPTSVQFIERRLMFGVVPLNLTTVKSALLFNGSANHAYFQVLDPVPFQGLLVSPVQGVVSVGGKAELKIMLSPNALIKFDTRIQVAIRGGKTLELRVGGTVEPPCVDIDLSNFNLGGVACGSMKKLEFQLINRTKTKTRCKFDLTRYEDFALEFPEIVTPEDLTYQARNPGKYSIILGGEEVTTGYLIFTPTEVAAYDFVLPVSINTVSAPTPTQTPVPPTPAPSNKNTIHNIINPKPIPVTIATPRKRVICTALRKPLDISKTSLNFTLTSDCYELAADSGSNTTRIQKTMFANVSDKVIMWSLDLDSCGPIIDDGTFRFVRESGAPFLTHNGGGVCGKLDPGETFVIGVFFCPDKAMLYQVKVPVIIDGDMANPFLYLSLTGVLERPIITFDSPAVSLTPVPLGISSSTKIVMAISGYRRQAELRLHLPEVECEDGSLVSPLTVKFEDNAAFDCYNIEPCLDMDKKSFITLKLRFECDRPLSFQAPIVFEDNLGNTYELNVTANADNCLLTCYPFVAQHRMDHQIVCEEGKMLRSLRRTSSSNRSVGEPIIANIATPVKSRPSTSATMSLFEVSSSAYESETSTDSALYDGGQRKGAVNKAGKSDSNAEAARRSLGSAMFPDEETEEGIFHQEVLYSVQRWFSAHGWPGGSYPIRIPDTLRRQHCRNETEHGVTKQGDESKSKGGSSDANNIRRDLKTIYEMVLHLAGRPIPGIPMNGPLPTNLTERVKQVYWQHSTMLTFIKNQGGLVASVKPEYLMEPKDYKHWKWLQEIEEVGGDVDAAITKRTVPTEDEAQLADIIFEAISKRAWTDVLLQLWKTLVLSRITPRQLKASRLPDHEFPPPVVNSDPLCSNIYNVSERIMLSWMNDMYSNYKDRLWYNNVKGGVPNSRWLVNFDYDLLDGLVLAACLGAYCPFLISTHLIDMYTKPETAEQCLHNALKVVNAMRYIGFDYDIQAIDITDPNPVSLLMLCVYLYQKLPLYLPKSTVTFTGTLHQTVQRQIKLSNPSNTKPLMYQAIISGYDACDYNVNSEGNTISIPPKGQINLAVEFKSRFLRPADAMLILVGHRVGSASGTTMVFKLASQVDDVTPLGIIREEAPCYELHKIDVAVRNPFNNEGEFRVICVETMDDTEETQRNKKSSPPKPKKKAKKVKSKINHGQRSMEMPSPPPQESTENLDLALQTAALHKTDDFGEGSSKMSAFFCPSETVYLKAHETRTIQIHFLPFNMGKYTCSVILINEKVGEFLYTVEVKAVYPQVSALPFKPGPNSVRISSAAAASRGLGQFGGRDDVVYWKCEEGQMLEEVLTVPMTNIRREEALITAAHQQMTEMEYERRRVTGTLNSSTITTQAVEQLTVGRKLQHNQKQPKARHHQGTTFMVTLDSKHFSCPSKINVPHPNSQNKPSTDTNGAATGVASRQRLKTGMVLDDGNIELPIKFMAEKSGHYPCRIILEAPDDIRVYQVESTVNPPGCSAQIELNAPVHQSVVQNIPIINTSKHDWHLDALIDGMGFYGPASLIAKAMQVTTYPLTFRPSYETSIDGSLVLENKADCHEHVFDLIGKATEPLPLEKIVLKGSVNVPWSRIIDVPNVTKKKLVYRVETDLPFLGGRPVITVLEGQLGKYELTALPRRRGKFSGVVAFVAGKNPLVQYDSDGDEIVGSDNEDDEYNGYKVWYSASCDIAPAPAERNISIKCNCQKRAIVEIGVNNPTDTDIKLEVEIYGMGLSGEKEILVPAKGSTSYELIFFPTCIGETKGSIIFYHDATGEFWYDIDLLAENPSITNLKKMSCELGRWTQQMISLTNPTAETLEFVPTISNANNFSLERDDQRPIVIQPGATLQVPLNFMPSALGEADHKAKITFHSEEFGEWVFTAMGSGTLPQPQEPVNLSSPAGASTTIIIPFRNPLDSAVNVDVILTEDIEGMMISDNEVQYQKIFRPKDKTADSPFKLLLKKSSSVRVGPKSTIDIPLSFAPEEMKMYEALCVVTVRTLSGSGWKYTEPPGENLANTSILPRDELYEIKWLYPIHGVTEAINPTAKSAVLECQARSRVEERLEVTLTGVAPSSSGQTRAIRARAVTPKDSDPTVPEGVVVADGIMVAKQFSYTFEYFSAEQRKALEHCIALSLVRQQRDRHSGVMTLVFNIVYAPYIQMRHDVMLVIKSATGGVWKFPVRFVASEPIADDVITLEAAGLDKTSSVGIRLTSQTRSPASYQAYLLGNSDPEFSVTPSTGELPPVDSNQGTLLIVSFTPHKYGKVYKGKLVVQTSEMQWTYDVVGTLPEYTPPQTQSSKLTKGLIARSADRRNFVLSNLKLTTTAVSSPIKGAPVMQRKAKNSTYCEDCSDWVPLNK